MDKNKVNIQQQIATNTPNKIYSGKDNCCRCGCKGKYYEPKDKMFKSMLDRSVNKFLSEDSTVDVYGNYINISYGNDRAYTIYFEKEVKIEE